VARVLAARMGVPDAAALEAVFRDADKNGDGQLGFDEVVAMMRKLGRSEQHAREEAQRLMDAMDEDKSQTIGLEEFKTGVIISSTASDKNKIKAAFDLFDIDHNGEVTPDEIHKMCDGVLSNQAIKELIDSVDVNRDGKINFSEFLRGMQGGSVSSSMVNPLAASIFTDIKSPPAREASPITTNPSHAFQSSVSTPSIMAISGPPQAPQHSSQMPPPAFIIGINGETTPTNGAPTSTSPVPGLGARPKSIVPLSMYPSFSPPPLFFFSSFN
jgi:calcium-binding protein CML